MKNLNAKFKFKCIFTVFTVLIIYNIYYTIFLQFKDIEDLYVSFMLIKGIWYFFRNGPFTLVIKAWMRTDWDQSKRASVGKYLSQYLSQYFLKTNLDRSEMSNMRRKNYMFPLIDV